MIADEKFINSKVVIKVSRDKVGYSLKSKQIF